MHQGRGVATRLNGARGSKLLVKPTGGSDWIMDHHHGHSTITGVVPYALHKSRPVPLTSFCRSPYKAKNYSTIRLVVTKNGEPFENSLIFESVILTTII